MAPRRDPRHESQSTVSSRPTGLSRKRLLRLGAGGLAAVAAGVAGGVGVTVVRPRVAHAATAPELGITPSNSPTTNRNNLVAALTNNPTLSITFPAGDYRLDNSKAANNNANYIVINDFAGTLTMQSGARLLFTDRTQGGLYFEGGTGAEFTGIVATFTTLPSVRNNLHIFLIRNTTDTTINGYTVNGSAGAGLLFSRCVRPRVTNVLITNTMADGLHFANCQDSYADEIRAENTGDDGLAFLNYADGPDLTGGFASDITIVNSKARGITVIGQRNVTVDHFGVNWSAVSGIKVGYESSYNTRVPTNVRFQNGFVYNGGQLSGGQSGNRFGIEVHHVGEVFFTNVDVDNAGTRGVSSYAHPFSQGGQGTVHLTDVVVTNAPSNGFNLQGGRYYLDELVARDTNESGYSISDASLVEYGDLHADRTSKTSSLRRAFDVQRNTQVNGSHLWVHDDQATPTGYRVFTGGTQAGTLGAIHGCVVNGGVEVQNNSGLSYSLAGCG